MLHHRLASRLLPLLAILFSAASASAFHEGGVASCKACHIMHESEDGAVPSFGPTGEALLRGANGSEVCLNCHATDFGAVLGNDPLAPPPERGGGNFTFLLEDDIYDGSGWGGGPGGGSSGPIVGAHAGHSVVAPGYGLYADPDRSVAPGGSYPSSELGCPSCHDPHGNQNYRMLYGQGQQTPDGFVYTTDAPDAEGIALQGPAENVSYHTAYQRGWTRWCGNCHGAFHTTTAQAFQHPVEGPMGTTKQDNYNLFNGEDDPTGGNYATAYIPELPLQDTGRTIDSTAGATATSEVSCMSCHRAHATSAPYSLRWDPNVIYLKDDGVVSGSYAIPSPYPTTSQRALCVKCHWDRARNHGYNRPCVQCHAKGMGGM